MCVPLSEDNSYIDELKKSLYSRTAPDVRTRRKLQSETGQGSELKTEWDRLPVLESKPGFDLNEQYQEHHKMSFFTKLFIVSAIFCLAALGFGAYLFLNGSNIISGDNISIQISGPVSVAGGTPVSFDIVATNKNNIELQLADLTVSFPAGSIDSADPGQPLKTYHKFIGNMTAGQSVKDTVSAIIYGEENLQKQIVVSMTYNVKGSTAVFTKSKSYDILLGSAPVSLAVSTYKEIASGQEFDLKVSLKSNSQQILKNVLLKGDFPFGYKFISSSAPSVGDNATWSIGDLPAGGQKTITIHGSLTGEDSDNRAFHFAVGTKSSDNPKVIGTQFTSIEQDIIIQKPFISLSIAVDSDQTASDHIGQFGQSQRIIISWLNNLPVSVSNMQISVKLSGTAYDRASVTPDSGYFDSANNTITWSRQTNSEFASVSAGEGGAVTFSIVPRDNGTSANTIVNPVVSMVASVSGNRTQETNVSQSVTAAVARNIKISSNVALSGRLVHTSGPFTNSGPIPPRVDQATTYTVIWDVDNASSAVGGAVVTATLPPYVKWLNSVSPASEDVSYDQNSGLVTWNVGNVSAYTLKSSKRREVAFQISFFPSITQTGQSPTLVNPASLSATDSFTGTSLSSQQGALTTRFSTDPSFMQGYEIVTGN